MTETKNSNGGRVVQFPGRWVGAKPVNDNARRARARTLAEVPGFLAAIATALTQSPNIPREAWIAAARVEVRSLRRVDAETVRAYALDAIRAGRGAA